MQPGERQTQGEGRRLLALQAWRVVESGITKSQKGGNMKRFKDVLVELANLNDCKREGEKNWFQFLTWATHLMVREH